MQSTERTRSYLSVAQAAAELNMAQATIRSWVLYRRIEFVKIGRRVLIPRKSLDDLIEANTIPVKRSI
jgi:excisionase family DNA binding protein